MNVRNMCMMIITLVVGVILTVGVLTPVIADSIGSGSGSGGSAHANDYWFTEMKAELIDGGAPEEFVDMYSPYYTKITQSTDMTITASYSDELDEGVMIVNGEEFVPLDYDIFVFPYMLGHFAVFDGYARFLISGLNYDVAEVHGDSVTFTDTMTSNGTETYEDLLYVATKTGEYMSCYSSFYDEYPDVYLDTDSELFIYAFDNDVRLSVNIVGSPADNVVIATDTFDFVTYGSATFSLDDGLYESMTFEANDTEYVWSGSQIDTFIAPVQVGSGSGSGGSVSGTLATLLTIVPILVLAGLVLMTVTMFRKS